MAQPDLYAVALCNHLSHDEACNKPHNYLGIQFPVSYRGESESTETFQIHIEIRIPITAGSSLLE